MTNKPIFAFRRLDHGFVQVFKDGKFIAGIEQNCYGRKLWQIERMPGGHYVDKNGFDCFTLTIAKQEIKRNF